LKFLLLAAGDVEALLETYDRERRVLPPPVLIWKWGWTKSAETWNGRIAMLAIVVVRVPLDDVVSRFGRAPQLVHMNMRLTPWCILTPPFKSFAGLCSCT